MVRSTGIRQLVVIFCPAFEKQHGNLLFFSKRLDLAIVVRFIVSVNLQLRLKEGENDEQSI